MLTPQQLFNKLTFFGLWGALYTPRYLCSNEILVRKNDFLDKCMDRLPPDSEALLGSSKNELVASFFKDAPGADSSKGGRPATLGSKFKDSMQELYDMLSATSPHL